MSDQLSSPYAGHYPPPPLAPQELRQAAPLGVVVLQVVLIVVLFAGAGALCGLLWEHLWTAPKGVVQGHIWYAADEKALRAEFSGTGLFVLIGLAAGAVLGGLCSWLLARVELVSLAAIAVGAVLAAYVMMRVGVHLGPHDPVSLAKTAADGTKLPGDLRIPHRWGPYACLPLGSLAAASVVLFIPRRQRR